MNDIIKADDFDPPLTGDQVVKVQEVINEALRRNQTAAVVEYPKQDGDFLVLGPEIFTGGPDNESNSVISWKGENYIRQQIAPIQASLKSYLQDEKVMVLKHGDWLPGKVSSIDKVSHHLHVETERGPVTIASPRNIRKL